MSEQNRIIVVENTQENTRLDSFLAEVVSEISRSRIQTMIKDGEILLNGNPAKASCKLCADDQIQVKIRESQPLTVVGQDIDLDIIYEDSDIIVLNKPQGMVVHPAFGHQQDTLVNALLYHCQDLSGINGVIRPGIVHRIDKDTSGLLVAAKNDAAHLGLSSQWQGHHITRIYQAILLGMMAEPSGVIDAPIGRHPRDRKKMAIEPIHGRNAITNYRVLERFPHYSYVELKLETGRTHQIRVHMAHLGHPVAGDPVYGPKKSKLDVSGQVLHAKVLGFKHPRTGEYLEFDSPLPDYFNQLLAQLRKGDL
ncbi:MAG: RluA family pseudouridine synthase [Clostridiales bacterium]